MYASGADTRPASTNDVQAFRTHRLTVQKIADIASWQLRPGGWRLLSNQADKGAFDGVYLEAVAAPGMGASLSASATAAFQLNSLLSLK